VCKALEYGPVDRLGTREVLPIDEALPIVPDDDDAEASSHDLAAASQWDIHFTPESSSCAHRYSLPLNAGRPDHVAPLFGLGNLPNSAGEPAKKGSAPKSVSRAREQDQ
jgi:hypothetical protein